MAYDLARTSARCMFCIAAITERKAYERARISARCLGRALVFCVICSQQLKPWLTMMVSCVLRSAGGRWGESVAEEGGQVGWEDRGGVAWGGWGERGSRILRRYFFAVSSMPKS